MQVQFFNDEMIECIESLFKKFDLYSKNIVPPNIAYIFDEIKINGTFFKIKIILTDKGISYFQCIDLIDLTDRNSCNIG